MPERAPAGHGVRSEIMAPAPFGSAMSAGSAPGAVPLSAGAILRAPDAHFRLTVIETHVDAVPAAARADDRDQDKDCAIHYCTKVTLAVFDVTDPRNTLA